MPGFFSSARPGTTVTHGKATFELPILYFRDDLFALFFTADANKVKALMPSDKLHPALLFGNKAAVGFAVFNYMETSIGPYGEIGVVVPTVYGPKPPPPVLPALMEARYPNFGSLVLHLPVTNTVARDAGRGQWGFTKFVADMNFTNTPEFLECRMSEEGAHILTIRVLKKGITIKETKPLITFSVKDGKLIKTIMPQKARHKFSIRPKGSFLQLGEHPVSESIREMGLSFRPIQSRYYLEHNVILPAGEVIEEGVRPLEGYYGKNRDGEHTCVYMKEGA